MPDAPDVTDVPFRFDKDAIDRLADQLGRCAKDHFSESEWKLLLAIFAAAADRVEIWGRLPGAQVDDSQGKIENPRDATVAELREQLLGAYVPGNPPAPLRRRVTPQKPGGGSPPP